MCRFLAYVGPPVTLSSLALETPHSLLQQCRAPRHQTLTKDNPDGFGAAWFAGDGIGRYRRATPMWEDAGFADVARRTTARAFVAAIRKATPGIALGELNTPPYVSGGWAFAHNGSVSGWVDGDAAARVRAITSPRRLAEIAGTTDSEALFAAILTAMDDGAAPAEAVGQVIAAVAAYQGGWLNVVLTDGARIYATRWGNSLFVLPRADAVVVASEPYDDDPAWEMVPDRRSVEAWPGAAAISEHPLAMVNP